MLIKGFTRFPLAHQQEGVLVSCFAIKLVGFAARFASDGIKQRGHSEAQFLPVLGADANSCSADHTILLKRSAHLAEPRFTSDKMTNFISASARCKPLLNPTRSFLNDGRDLLVQ